jgi:ABC-type bacteriocin/lantibiotic exporter with double-glycine peptidase domain
MLPIFNKTKEHMQDVFHSIGGASSVTYEQFSNLRTIQNLAGTVQARWRWEEKQNKVLEKKQKIQNLSATSMSISTLIQQLINLAFLTLAILLFMDREITIGQVVAATTISGMIIGPILQLIQSIDDIGQLGVSFEKIDEIVTSKVEEENNEHPFPENFSKIEFKDIWFKYGSDFSPWILKGINLEVKRGQKIAFVGPSGSGKSTLSYMLNLIYQPQKGEVLFDQTSNVNLGLSSLRANVSMIVQENSVLAGTILSNITLGDTNPDLARAMNAATLAEAHEFIMAMPKGYQTAIGGEHGVNMSGGQRQRIGIARAIYKSPAIIIMDEATSALDTLTEKRVMNNLYQHLKDTTCFIIAHRFNTIMSADVIVVIQDGKIKELGSHDELMKKQNIYFKMFKKQVSL